MRRGVAAATLAIALACAVTASPAVAVAAFSGAHGQLLSLTGTRHNATQTSNWFGYQRSGLGSLGSSQVTQFHQVAGDWTVPTVTAHGTGADQASSDWIGIGGGCPDSGCALPADATLIQTGTEQDVDSAGHPSYSAWWELIPSPSITIATITPSPGDRMHAEISEGAPGLWTITLQDTTNHQSFTTTLPYTSTHLTAEWIEETPLLVSSAAMASLPNLTNPAFDNAQVNRGAANLTPVGQVQLVDANNKIIGVPSAPDFDADGFAACTWTTFCAAPLTS